MSVALRRELARVAHRARQYQIYVFLTVAWAAIAIVFGFPLVGGYPIGNPVEPLAAVVAIGLAALVAAIVVANRSHRDPQALARRVESRYPELQTGLLAAVEREGSEDPIRTRGFLESSVLHEVLEHGRAQDWAEAYPRKQLRRVQILHAVALCAMIGVVVALAARTLDPGAKYSTSGVVASGVIEVEPGNTEVERGTSLLVVAKFASGAPEAVKLVVEGEFPTLLMMSRSLDDPTFAGRIASVVADLKYYVEAGGVRSESFRVHAFEYPEVRRIDAQLRFPNYTGMTPRSVADIRHVTAIEGTDLTLQVRLNTRVAEAQLVDETGAATSLTAIEGTEPIYGANWVLTDSHRYKILLKGTDGRAAKRDAELSVNVTRNKPPVLALSQPRGDVRVTPLEELAVRAKMTDDFGVVRHGLQYSLAGEPPREVVLEESHPAKKVVEAAHQIDFETLKAQPDQLVTFSLWAEDIGPDGKPRRVDGDMTFAEVRHFEEIFRQGTPPPGGASQAQQQDQQGNTRQAEKLAEAQKQIINASWTLLRREPKTGPSPPFAPDVAVIRDSQKEVIEQAQPMAAKLTDAGSKASLERAVKHMGEAVGLLEAAAKNAKPEELKAAIAAEQSAYQDLLKLRAREFEVIRQQQQNAQARGPNSGQSTAQRQLDQLELSAEENRYEERSSAKARDQALTEREKAQAETRQVVNRLRELAQRQTDLNERLKEIQSALETAKDEAARQEAERQLKRLREQQQQMLRDADETQERMENEANRDRMAEARPQMEQGRENIRKASDALEQGKLAQAINEGARAGKQMEQLRDQLRKESANRFGEDLGEMRQQAQTLDENQKKLAEALEAARAQPQGGGLRGDPQRKQVQEKTDAQAKELADLLDRMKKTVEEAEDVEPLLAKSLFDAAQKANAGGLPEALDEARKLAEAGILDEAAQTSRQAVAGVNQLREGVEKAAESILGDDAAALKRAEGEIADLEKQLNREITQNGGGNNRPDPATDGDRPSEKTPANRPGSGDPPKGKSGQGQPGDGDQTAEKGEPGKAARGKQSQKAGGTQPAEKGEPGKGAGGGQPGEGESKAPGSQPAEKGEPGKGAGGGGGAPKGAPNRRSLRGGDPQPPPQNPQGGNRGGNDANGGGGRGGPAEGPILGDGFRQWSDRMRDVEELLDDPALRAEAAGVRDRVRGAREEFKRHAKTPDWTQMQDTVAEPIRELHKKIAEEVRRRDKPDSLVPIDRDPVPPRYAEGVRRYYERLGSGQ